MLHSLLPLTLINVLRNLDVDRKSLMWTLECDSENTEMTLKWVTKCQQHERGNVIGVNMVNRAEIPVRRKPPSTIKRDRQRMAHFWQTGKWRSLESTKPETENVNSAQPKSETEANNLKLEEVSTKTLYVHPDKVSVANFAVQTDSTGSSIQNSETQTDNTMDTAVNKLVQTTHSCHTLFDNSSRTFSTQTKLCEMKTTTTQTENPATDTPCVHAQTESTQSVISESGSRQLEQFQDTDTETIHKCSAAIIPEENVKISRKEYLTRKPKYGYQCVPRKNRIYEHAPTSEQLQFLQTIAPIATVEPCFKSRYDFEIAEVENRYHSFGTKMQYNVRYQSGRRTRVSEDVIPPRVLLKFLGTYPKNCYDEELDETESEPSACESED